MRVCIITFLFCIMAVLPSPAVGQAAVNEESGAAYKAGVRLYNEGEYERSIEQFVKAYELDGRNISALFAHGLALNRLKRYVEAAGLFGKVLEHEPDHIKAIKGMYGSYADADENEKALAACDRGIAALPEDHYFYLAKARLLLKLERYAEAVPLLEKAHEIEPGNMDIAENLMQTLAKAGRIEEAHELALIILEHDKNNARAHLIVADYKRLMGKLEEALKEYEAAAQDIETKAYAEHFKEVIEQQLEEKEIEEEYEAKLSAEDEKTGQSQKQDAEKTDQSEKKEVKKTVQPEKQKTKKTILSLFNKPSKESSPSKSVTSQDGNKGVVLLLFIMVAVVFALVLINVVMTYRKR